MRTEPGCHLHCTSSRLVPLSHFNIAKLFNDHIFRILFRPMIVDWLYWKWALKHVFLHILMHHSSDFSYYRSFVYYGKMFKNSKKNKNKLRTTYPKNHENFKNSKPRVQFYWFLQKKDCIWENINFCLVTRSKARI